MFHIIQNASGTSDAQASVTKGWWQDYCDSQGYTYHLLQEATPDRFFTWAKIKAALIVIAAMQPGDRWLLADTDTIIKRYMLKETLHDVLSPDADLGMVEYWPSDKRKAWDANGVQFPCPHYYNSGIVFGVKSPAVDAMMQTAWDQGTVPAMEHGDEPRLNLLKDTVRFAPIDSRYNAFGSVPPSSKPNVIRAFHGETDKRRVPGLLKMAHTLDDF